jgi:hypothetical protein
VEKITYYILRPADEWNNTSYKEIVAEKFNILMPDGKKNIFINNTFYPEIPPEQWIESSREMFLRYDYKIGNRKIWLHIMGPNEWY